jgi:hypothetical protein
MTHSEFKNNMKSINKLFNELTDKFNTLPQELQNEILNYHNNNATIQHCIRWGLKASEEIIDNSITIFNNAEENYIKQ